MVLRETNGPQTRFVTAMFIIELNLCSNYRAYSSLINKRKKFITSLFFSQVFWTVCKILAGNYDSSGCQGKLCVLEWNLHHVLTLRVMYNLGAREKVIISVRLNVEGIAGYTLPFVTCSKWSCRCTLVAKLRFELVAVMRFPRQKNFQRWIKLLYFDTWGIRKVVFFSYRPFVAIALYRLISYVMHIAAMLLLFLMNELAMKSPYESVPFYLLRPVNFFARRTRNILYYFCAVIFSCLVIFLFCSEKKCKCGKLARNYKARGKELDRNFFASRITWRWFRKIY